MSRVLLDQSTPRPLGRLLVNHQVRTADDEGWSRLSNGDLIAAAEAAGFAVLITADRNIRYQQNLSARVISLIVLSTNAWPVIRVDPGPIVAAVATATPGSYAEVDYDRPPLRRRHRPPGLT